MRRTDLEPIKTRAGQSPWQELPEMAVSHLSERAGIEAGLRVVEMFHIHHADRFFQSGHPQAGVMRIQAANQIIRLRVDIVGAMK
ncbi:hypothetical protein [Falsiruegeria litorea]|uniref:hypothetical protein n=1 Tax=Falsiruegeria litorea TaxID=1280831 RepID=UPI001BFE108E|nr:hypothetical protein [Falsiruegeria litorea]MBT8169892.1 hypothetical protein [Falsiruegeria litorea]